MTVCARCAEENPDHAKFCLNCGAPLDAGQRPSEQRKTVTILFADVVNSTGRGESTDPETTRHMLARYFEAMKGALERHGGLVEKFIGDAVMAVFGIPTVHEDDALRAVRAGVDMLAALETLNAELVGTGWRPLAVRVGINTGEVVTGDPASGHTLVTGDAVNVAARLEQAAGPGEILLGPATHQLVRNAVEGKRVPPLDMKGKTAPVAAFRLGGLLARPGSGRRHDTPLVGRERELRLLREAFDRAVSDEGSHLFTLLGPAGVGKSRLIHEFVAAVRDEGEVMRARCLPYGEGITYWPIAELALSAAGIAPSDAPAEARTKLAAYLGDVEGREAIVERVASAIGLSDAGVPNEEIFWGVRRLLEAVARRRPLVVIIDDLHWAEPTFLDLVEHVADMSREAPILILAVARPELLDVRPTWGGGKLNATTILLEPLSGEQSVVLVTNLLGDPDLARAIHQRVGDTAEGNPLFVEELVSMLIDQGVLHRGADGWVAEQSLDQISVPPTVAALVAARLDRLEASERDLVGRASVVGKVFHRSAVAELSPPGRREDLAARLMTLVRKELVRPAASSEVGDEAFRFRHILVRDAAYGSLPKEQRADLHARFADWLERTAGDRLQEYEEVIAYHLEQAHVARSELGLMDDVTRGIGTRAADHLEASGDRALHRRDLTAAVSLFGRAAKLTDDDRRRAELYLSIGVAMGELGHVEDALRLFEDARDTAQIAGAELLAMEARLEELSVEQFIDPSVDDTELVAVAEDLKRRAAEAGDIRAQIAGHVARGGAYLTVCRWQDQLRELEAAAALLVTDGSTWHGGDIGMQVLNSLRYGPTPVSAAIARIEEAARDSGISVPQQAIGAPLYAMVGRFDDARRMYRDGMAYMAERGVLVRLGGLSLSSGIVELIAGDPEAAERNYAVGIDVLRGIGETGVLSTVAAMCGIAQLRQGKLEAAMESVALAQLTGSAHDIATQATWRMVAAMAAAQRGELKRATALAAEALALLEPTDFLELRGLGHEARAHVRNASGERDAAAEDLRHAIAEYDAKEDIADATRVRAELGALRAS
ncbi:MAG: adenylate/guanylate cyclase domain-containing protein [Chloroflexota bacterium]